MVTNHSIALVLSGGGARGAYQMGVWQAMRELGFDQHVQVITGCSIGAINGALLTQLDWDKALDLWEQVQPAQVFDCLQDNNTGFNQALMRDWMQHGGIRVEGLKKLLREHLDETLIRQSPIDFGLVVYNKTLRKGQSLFTQDIPEGLLVEYVIASATFPVFQPHQIGDDLYLDGGLHSILPMDMAFAKAGTDIVIGVDVAEASRFSPQQWRWRRQYQDRLIYIRPSKILPSPMNFSEKSRRFQMELGYNDAIKILQQKNDLLHKASAA
ncbi:MAG: patatin-like phospholipase family protein [Saprospiraceae bacterium]